MSRDYLDQTLNNLKTQLLHLEEMVSTAAIEAVDALLTNDIEKSKEVYLNDKEINAKRFEIENECLITIATQQPLATDLRELASILEIVTDSMRIWLGQACATRKCSCCFCLAGTLSQRRARCHYQPRRHVN